MLTEAEQSAGLARFVPAIERARNFTGWDFPDLKHPVLLEPGPPWDYEALVREYAAQRTAALDLGTGGGEFVEGIRDALPPLTVATEEWHVNAPIAYKRLCPIAVDAVWCRSLHLPFQSECFDLVFDRHEELDPAEIWRVLRPGGAIVTQQIGPENWRELRRFFGGATAGNRSESRLTDFGDIRMQYSCGFESAGMRVLRSEQHNHRVAYASLTDFVFMLLITPWTIPDLDLERDLELLLALEEDCMAPEGLVLTWSRFLIVAEKSY